MSHYKTIEVDNKEFRYIIGNHKTKIDRVYKDDGRVVAISTIGTFFNIAIGYSYNEDKIEVRPSHIEKVVRRELNIQPREYDWDIPQTKESDLGPKTRGFRNLIGVKIVDIRISAINEVILEGENGDRYAIETENSGPLGLGVISLRVLKGNEAES